MIVNGSFVKRNGNIFVVKRDKHGNYFTSMVLGETRVTSWHRTPLKKLKTEYKEVPAGELPDRLKALDNL